MFRFIFLISVSLTMAVWARELTEDEFMKTCGKIMEPPSINCCKTVEILINDKKNVDLMKECSQLPSKPPSCEREICMASKEGWASADGTMDKTKQSAMIDEVFKGFSPEIITTLKEKCVKGDISQMGPPDECIVRKFGKCMHMYMMAACPIWNDTGACQGLKTAASECYKLLA